MRKLVLALPLAALLAGFAFAPLPAAAETVSKSTALVTGNLAMHSGPGSSYPSVGVLPDGVRVHLRECTPNGNWCLIANPGGREGWVRASYLRGTPAKVDATPFDSFTDDLLFPKWRSHDRW